MTERCCPSPEFERHKGNGKPKVVLPDGEKTAFYSRPSSWGDVIQDEYHLNLYQQRMTAIGLALKPELVLSVLAHKDQTDRDNKRRLNSIVEQAKVAAGAGERSTLGTAYHKLLETLDMGGEVDYDILSPDVQATLDAYLTATHDLGLKHEHYEHAVVNDDMRLAGTADRHAWYDGALRIVDIKTGDNDPNYPAKAAIQLAIYAHSVLYNVQTGDRTDVEVAQDYGLMVHLPADQGRCDIYRINLELGWEGAQLAGSVRKWQGLSASEFIERIG